MNLGLTRVVTAVVLAGAATVVASPTVAQAVNGNRYASPTGTGALCSKSAPCGIVEAINNAPAGATVTLGGGVYGESTPLSTALTDSGGALVIRGPSHGKRADIVTSAGMRLANGSSLSSVDIDYSGPSNALVVQGGGGGVSRVDVTATDTSATACSTYGTSLFDSVCWATGNNGAALYVVDDAASPQELDSNLIGDTLEATGAAGIGVDAGAGANTTIALSMLDTIVHGTHTDLDITASTASSEVDITPNYTDFYTVTIEPGGSGTVNVSPTHAIDATPKFVDAAHGDFRERRASPTVDAGALPIAHTEDLAGNPRQLGPATDAGAYELPEKAKVGAVKVSKVTRHTAKLTVKVNPEGLPTRAVADVASGRWHTTVRFGRAGHGLTRRTLSAKARGLSRHTSYRVQVVATNAAGHTASTKRRFRTG